MFCERFRCPESKFEKRAFRKCLYWHARIVAPVLKIFMPSLFKHDFELMRGLGEATDAKGAGVELFRLQELNLDGGFMRKTLRIRVSGRKAYLLSGRIFGRDPRKSSTPSLARIPKTSTVLLNHQEAADT